MNLNKGARVKTRHGEGKIVGFDLKGTKNQRYVVRIDKAYGDSFSKSLFPNNELCYFKHEML